MFFFVLEIFIWLLFFGFFFFKQKTAYEMRISDWSSDVCSSDLDPRDVAGCAWSATAGVVRGLRDGLDQAAHLLVVGHLGDVGLGEIGRASCRERVCQYV